MNMVYILSDFAKKQGYTVESYESVDSTNLIAQRKAQAGHQGYLWIVAQEQLQEGQGEGGHGIVQKGTFILVFC